MKEEGVHVLRGSGTKGSGEGHGVSQSVWTAALGFDRRV